jgi:hypothetical protein
MVSGKSDANHTPFFTAEAVPVGRMGQCRVLLELTFETRKTHLPQRRRGTEKIAEFFKYSQIRNSEEK